MSETSVSAGNSVCAVKVYTRVRPISKNEIREEKEIKSKAAAVFAVPNKPQMLEPLQSCCTICDTQKRDSERETVSGTQ